jgi:hypothetical protein
MSVRGFSKLAAKLTGWTTCTVRLKPGATEVPLGGKPMLALCAKHAVVKTERNAVTVNFMMTGKMDY